MPSLADVRGSTCVSQRGQNELGSWLLLADGMDRKVEGRELRIKDFNPSVPSRPSQHEQDKPACHTKDKLSDEPKNTDGFPVSLL